MYKYQRGTWSQNWPNKVLLQLQNMTLKNRETSMPVCARVSVTLYLIEASSHSWSFKWSLYKCTFEHKYQLCVWSKGAEAREQSRPQVPAWCQRVCELPKAATAALGTERVALYGWKLHFSVMDLILNPGIHLSQSFSFSTVHNRQATPHQHRLMGFFTGPAWK